MTELTWVLTGSLLILAVAFIRKALGGRLRPGLRYALWALVLLRLLYPGSLWTGPVSVESAASRSELVRDMESVRDMDDIRMETDGSVTGLPRDAGTAARSEEGAQAQPDNAAPQTSNNTTSAPVQYVPVASDVTQERFHRMELALDLSRIARLVWLTGAAVTAVLMISANVTLYVRLRRRRRPVAVRCPVPVWEVEGLDSSCLFAGNVYVNPETASDRERLRHVLAHEMSHRRHLDQLWAVLRCAALSLHWYNPLVWWASALSRQDGELCADAGALRHLGEREWESYGATLIELSRRPASLSPLCAATTMAGTKKQLRERVVMIARRPRATLAVALAAAMIAGIAAGCAFAGAGDGPADNGGDDTPSQDVQPGPEDSGPDGDDNSDNDARPVLDDGLFYGDGWTMEVPDQVSDGETTEKLEKRITTDGGELYFIFFNSADSCLTVDHGEGTAAQVMESYRAGDTKGVYDEENMVLYLEDGNAEYWFIDDPRGGSWTVTVVSDKYMDDFHRMLSTFAPDPEAQPVIDMLRGGDDLRPFLEGLDPAEVTLSRHTGGSDEAETLNGGGAALAGKYMEMLMSFRWLEAEPLSEAYRSGYIVLDNGLEDGGWRISVYTALQGRTCVETPEGETWISLRGTTDPDVSLDPYSILSQWCSDIEAARDYSNGGTPLTGDELEYWREALRGDRLVGDTWYPSPVNGFFLSCWDDPRELDLGEMLMYFGFPEDSEPEMTPTGQEAEDVRMALMKIDKDTAVMAFGSLPCHKIPASAVDAVLTRYAGITLDDMDRDWRSELFYLEQYDSFYTFTSDFGPGSFYPCYGEHDGDITALYSGTTVLKIRETADGWTLLSHLPDQNSQI